MNKTGIVIIGTLLALHYMMNQSQLNSDLRSLLKIAGAMLAARGYGSTAGWLNSEEVIGLVLMLAGWWWSRTHHADTPRK